MGLFILFLIIIIVILISIRAGIDSDEDSDEDSEEEEEEIDYKSVNFEGNNYNIYPSRVVVEKLYRAVKPLDKVVVFGIDDFDQYEKNLEQFDNSSFKDLIVGLYNKYAPGAKGKTFLLYINFRKRYKEPYPSRYSAKISAQGDTAHSVAVIYENENHMISVNPHTSTRDLEKVKKFKKYINNDYNQLIIMSTDYFYNKKNAFNYYGDYDMNDLDELKNMDSVIFITDNFSPFGDEFKGYKLVLDAPQETSDLYFGSNEGKLKILEFVKIPNIVIYYGFLYEGREILLLGEDVVEDGFHDVEYAYSFTRYIGAMKDCDFISDLRNDGKLAATNIPNDKITQIGCNIKFLLPNNYRNIIIRNLTSEKLFKIIEKLFDFAENFEEAGGAKEVFEKIRDTLKVVGEIKINYSGWFKSIKNTFAKMNIEKLIETMIVLSTNLLILSNMVRNKIICCHDDINIKYLANFLIWTGASYFSDEQKNTEVEIKLIDLFFGNYKFPENFKQTTAKSSYMKKSIPPPSQQGCIIF